MSKLISEFVPYLTGFLLGVGITLIYCSTILARSSKDWSKLMSIAIKNLTPDIYTRKESSDETNETTTSTM